MGFWRSLYYYAGWEYKPTEATEETKRNRHEVLVQIRSYNNNIKDIVLHEEGEIPKKIKATRTPTPTECDAPKTIQEYTELFEGFDIPPKKKRKRKRNCNKLNF